MTRRWKVQAPPSEDSQSSKGHRWKVTQDSVVMLWQEQTRRSEPSGEPRAEQCLEGNPGS